VAAGLCWTRVGGDLLYVETSRVAGDGKVTLTGQLGDVLQESVHIALSWIWSHARTVPPCVAPLPFGAGRRFQFGLDRSANLLESTNLHVHFPSGGVSKDGPSAGLAIVVALASLFTDCAMRADTAMSGEVTLSGQVLPVRVFSTSKRATAHSPLQVGGLREKVTAAFANGFKRVILPKPNEPQVVELPQEIKVPLQEFYVVLVVKSPACCRTTWRSSTWSASSRASRRPSRAARPSSRPKASCDAPVRFRWY